MEPVSGPSEAVGGGRGEGAACIGPSKDRSVVKDGASERARAWAKTGGAAAAATATEEEFSSFALYINCR